MKEAPLTEVRLSVLPACRCRLRKPPTTGNSMPCTRRISRTRSSSCRTQAITNCGRWSMMERSFYENCANGRPSGRALKRHRRKRVLLRGAACASVDTLSVSDRATTVRQRAASALVLTRGHRGERRSLPRGARSDNPQVGGSSPPAATSIPCHRRLIPTRAASSPGRKESFSILVRAFARLAALAWSAKRSLGGVMPMRSFVGEALGLALAAACGGTSSPAGNQNPGNTGGGAKVMLTITVSGQGSVTAPAPFFACAGTCAQPLAAGPAVQRAALPAAGMLFTGWSGACSGTGGCTLTLAQDTQVGAAFAPAPPASVLLTVHRVGEGDGRVVSSPAGIACPGICAMSVPAGTAVTLSSNATATSQFEEFGGGCSGLTCA